MDKPIKKKKLKTDAPLWAAALVLLISIYFACWVFNLKME